MTNAQIDYINEDSQVEQIGFLKRVTGVVISPAKVMESLSARPRVILPLILAAVSLMLLYLIRFPLYQDYLRQSAIASSAFTQSLTGISMTPEMIDANISVSSISGLITTPITSLIAWLLTAALYFAIFKIGGAKGRFKQYLSITGYAYVITALGYLVTLVTSFFTGSLHQDVPLTSLASLFSGGLKGQFFYGVLKGLDIFTIWYAAVFAIGMYKVSGFKKHTAYGIVAGLFIIGLLIKGISETFVGSYL